MIAAPSRSGKRNIDTEPAESFFGKVNPGLLLAVVAAILFAVRLLAPADLLDQDQERPASYVLDAIKNGHWVCQQDYLNDITSKPPMWTWLSAIPTLVAGRINLFTLYLPGALAAFGTALCLFGWGRARFGASAALLGALALMLCPAGLKEFGLARTDGVIAFTVSLAAFLGYRSWMTGRGWTWFWLAAAASTLTKGPLGLVLAGGGLLAVFWERKDSGLKLKGHHGLGVVFFFLICGGWFWLAYQQYGSALTDKMLGRELLGHAVSGSRSRWPGALFWQPILFYLGRSAPGSVFGLMGLWRVLKHPAHIPEERQFERFLFCWFAVGLVIFSLAPHQRADLLWPIMPPAALLGGRELFRFLLPQFGPRRRLQIVSVSAITLIVAFGLYYFGPHGRKGIVRQTLMLKNLAAEIEKHGGPDFPLSYVDARMTLQVYLNTLRPAISARRAADLLSSDEPVFMAVQDFEKFKTNLAISHPPVYTVLTAGIANGVCPAQIVGNRPELAAADAAAFCAGTIFVRIHGGRVSLSSQSNLTVFVAETGGDITVTNEGDAPAKYSMTINRAGERKKLEKTLSAGEVWKLTFGPRKPG